MRAAGLPTPGLPTPGLPEAGLWAAGLREAGLWAAGLREAGATGTPGENWSWPPTTGTKWPNCGPSWPRPRCPATSKSCPPPISTSPRRSRTA
ncbi:MAG: hypothetical protein LBG60_03780 [Bifidobacteriaceae bacterium]|nr:hypothetical protein [Bifidobacteriaceae bacterium]